MKTEAQCKEVFSRYTKLKSSRQIWENHWQDIANFVMPRKDQFTKTSQPGEKKGIVLYDSTAIKSNGLLAGALHGFLTNPSSYWFEFTTGIPELDTADDVRIWLEQTKEVCHAAINGSNFHPENDEFNLDLGSFGTAGMTCEEDDAELLRFSARNVAEFVVEENSKGVIDTVIRKFQWNLRQITLEFGLGYCKQFPKIAELINKGNIENNTDKFDILHVISPRDKEKRSGKTGKLSWEFESCYYAEVAGEHYELSESGYQEMPIAVARWSKTTGEVYGRSPAMSVLPEVKMLNSMRENILRAAEKTVNPPLELPDEGYLRPNLRPGALNYFRSGTSPDERIRPIIINPNINFGYQEVEEARKSIREAFFYDQLKLNNGPQMTATEVMQRRDEMLRLMGPLVGRMHTEFLRPLTQRVYKICERMGRIPKPPMSLQKRKIDVQYSSVIAIAQRMSEMDNVQRTMQAVAPFIQIDPSSADLIDCAAGVKYFMKRGGMPAAVLRTDADYKKVQAQKQQQMQQQQQMIQEQHAAEVASKAAPVMRGVMNVAQ